MVTSPEVIIGGGATDHLDAPSRRSAFYFLHTWRAAMVIVRIGRGVQCSDATFKTTRVFSR
jgi:hypothetical protein